MTGKLPNVLLIVVAGLLAAVVAAPPTLSAQEKDAANAPPQQKSSAEKTNAKKPGAKQPSSLDQQLLEDLGGDLLEGLDLPTASSAGGEKPSKPKTPQGDAPSAGQTPAKPASEGRTTARADEKENVVPDADQPLLDQLIDGEDVDLSGRSDPILDIGHRMKTVERMISQRNTSAGTQQMQREIVADIDRLIEQLRQQRRQASQSQSSRRKSSGSPPMPGGRQEPGDRESDKPADESQQRMGKNEDESYQLGAMEDLLKDVWGHLPERIRRQMLAGSGEEVLPKYQKLIEEYYKRLAEDAEKYP